MPHLNANQYKSKSPLTAWDKARIKQLQPMDMWFYNYAKQIHNIRWQRYLNTQKGEKAHIVDTQKFISNLSSQISGCKSTRYIMSCPENGFYFHMPSGNNVTDQQQTIILPKPQLENNPRSSDVNENQDNGSA